MHYQNNSLTYEKTLVGGPIGFITGTAIRHSCFSHRELGIAITPGRYSIGPWNIL